MLNKKTNHSYSHVKIPIAVLTAAGSFLLLTKRLWWVGIVCAIISIVVSRSIIKREDENKRKLGLITTVSTIIAAVLYLIIQGPNV